MSAIGVVSPPLFPSEFEQEQAALQFVDFVLSKMPDYSNFVLLDKIRAFISFISEEKLTRILHSYNMIQKILVKEGYLERNRNFTTNYEMTGLGRDKKKEILNQLEQNIYMLTDLQQWLLDYLFNNQGKFQIENFPTEVVTKFKSSKMLLQTTLDNLADMNNVNKENGYYRISDEGKNSVRDRIENSSKLFPKILQAYFTTQQGEGLSHEELVYNITEENSFSLRYAGKKIKSIPREYKNIELPTQPVQNFHFGDQIRGDKFDNKGILIKDSTIKESQQSVGSSSIRVDKNIKSKPNRIKTIGKIIAAVTGLLLAVIGLIKLIAYLKLHHVF